MALDRRPQEHGRKRFTRTCCPVDAGQGHGGILKLKDRERGDKRLRKRLVPAIILMVIILIGLGPACSKTAARLITALMQNPGQGSDRDFTGPDRDQLLVGHD